jgi:glycosyltransferase involved in cell wall biosynthesis
MITLSLCMIVKDEEQVLARCLDSVRDVFDEIVIVDTGSTDQTKQIAERYTQNIYDFNWNDDFSAARNESFARAAMDYCMWMDADDILLEADRQALLQLKASLPAETDVVMMKYHVQFDDQGNPTYSYYRERLIRRKPAPLWQGFVHEVIAPFGNILYSDIAVTHRRVKKSSSDRNLKIYEAKKEQGVPFDPRAEFYYARELYYHGWYEKAIYEFEQFLQRPDGWAENKIEACRMLSYCYQDAGQPEKILPALFQSFAYDIPRAELCCEIGFYFAERQAYQLAVFWYEQALKTPRNDQSGAFVLPDCYGYIPAIQLCVCYDRLGNLAAAKQYNDLAGKFKPDAEAYQHNRDYFLSFEE